MSSVRRTQVEATIAAIREMFKQGKPFPCDSPTTAKDTKPNIAAEAKRRGLKVEDLRKARRLYNAYKAKKQLDKLCKYIEKTQAKQDAKLSVVGPTHIIRLLTVPAGRRQEFLQRAATNGWSQRTLDEAIRTAFGARREGGRRPRVPSDLADFLADTQLQCEIWRRWHELLEWKSADKPNHITLEFLSRPIRDRIETASKAVKELGIVVSASLHRLRKKRDQQKDSENGATGTTGRGKRRIRTRVDRP